MTIPDKRCCGTYNLRLRTYDFLLVWLNQVSVGVFIVVNDQSFFTAGQFIAAGGFDREQEGAPR